MIVDNDLIIALEQEYPGAKHFKNFWVGFLVTNGTIQEVDAEILGWEVEGVEQPPQESFAALVEKHKDAIEAHKNRPPEKVTKAQGKAALIEAGVWQDVLDAIEAIDDPKERMIAEVAFNDTQDWERDSPTLNAMAAKLGWTQKFLDDLFRAAAKIKL